MTRRSTHHSTLVLARTFEAALPVVYAAISDPMERKRVCAVSGPLRLHLDDADFRVGGRDSFRFGPRDSLRFHGHATYLDIVPEYRVVSADAVYDGDVRLSAALTTLDLKAIGHRSQLKITAQTVWLDDGDRVDGAGGRHETLLASLGRYLEGRSDAPGAS